MLYSAGVALLLAVAALAAERLCLSARLPTRWVWALAIVVSVAAPALLPWASAPALPGATGTPTLTVAAGIPGLATAAPGDVALPPPYAPLERLLVFGWLVGSAVVTTLLIHSLAVLERDRRSWSVRAVGGRHVRVSRSTGPAVAGFLWPEVVVPARVLDWDEPSQQLLVAHETEHERSGDPHLLLASLLVLVLVPWNPVLWWLARRLRFAIEIDCDARVLRSGRSVDAYGELLIRAATTASPTLVPVAAFSRSPSLLERRIRVFARPFRRPRPILRLALGALVVSVPLTVYALPSPPRPDLEGIWLGPLKGAPYLGAGGASPGSAGATPPPELLRGPAFSNYEVRPELRNAPEFHRALVERYRQEQPLLLPTDTAVLWALIDVAGAVHSAQLSRSSGDLALDRAARETLSETARFTPARTAGLRVPAWIQLPVALPHAPLDGGARGTVRVPIATTPLAPPRARGGDAGGAGLPPGSRPELLDPRAFQRLVAQSQPAELRSASGSSVMWAYVDASGTVRSTRMAATSGNAQLDLIAREALRQARFSPAQGPRGGVDAWVQVPVEFSPR